MGGNDLEGNMAYYGSEAQIENLTPALAALSDFAISQCGLH